ncbi:MAG: hypothetical protein QM757_16650 [Paludibaculum sp.]
MDTPEEKQAAIGYDAITELEKRELFRKIEAELVKVSIETRTRFMYRGLVPENIPIKSDVERLEAALVAWLVDPNRERCVRVEAPRR